MDALIYDHFSFAYPNASKRVLSEVDWAVPQGAFALLVGDTGSGKTTLLRCAKPEVAPEGARAGSVRVFGEALVPGARSLDVGYVFQSPENQLVCDTVWHELAFGLENLGLEQELMRRRVAEVAHFFGMEPWFRRNVETLSGGQKQLVNLASVLAMRPRVLLLDEPTAQLDPVAQQNFLYALFRVNRELGITVVVATHAPEAMIDYATCAARVENGQVSSCDLSVFRFGEDAACRSLGDAGAAVVSCAAPATASAALAPGCSSAAQGSCELLVLKDVFFRYARDAQWVLRGLDLSLPQGAVHAVVGGNGCGKSTLLRVLAGVLAPERGRVRNGLRHEQALLPQDPKALLVCDTVREELEEWAGNVGYGAKEIAATLERVGLVGFEEQHPYDLSGGQQQMLALAKLMLARPRLLLLDEPVKGLDAPSKMKVACVLDSLRAQGCTLVLVTHDLAFASRVADDMTMLFDGEVACSQPTRAFCEQNLFYHPRLDQFTRLWDAQRGCV